MFAHTTLHVEVIGTGWFSKTKTQGVGLLKIAIQIMDFHIHCVFFGGGPKWPEMENEGIIKQMELPRAFVHESRVDWSGVVDFPFEFPTNSSRYMNL